jgi:hypothetical protein
MPEETRMLTLQSHTPTTTLLSRFRVLLIDSSLKIIRFCHFTFEEFAALTSNNICYVLAVDSTSIFAHQFETIFVLYKLYHYYSVHRGLIQPLQHNIEK